MRPLDWLVLAAWLSFIVTYGLYRGRGSDSVDQYLRAGKTMPWYAMGLSIIATQASAITFISTTGQGFADGMRFVQFYFGLPLAMVVIAAVAVPIFHRANVYTAYEYLETRFDAKTRALVSIIFLVQRGLGAGIALYAPAVALSVVLGWPDRVTTIVMGVLVVIYTASGGIKAVTWADVQQMVIIFVALILSLILAVHALPSTISFLDAVRLAGAAGRLNAVDLHFHPNDRYNLWSGLIGGAFLALAYFGCDQSQVQRYLTGKSIDESRRGLLFTAIAKIPMQAFILFIGAMVFSLSLFSPFPAIFQPVEAARVAQTSDWQPLNQDYQRAFEKRRVAAAQLARSLRGQGRDGQGDLQSFRQAQHDFTQRRQDAIALVEKQQHGQKFDDTNYIFLSFVTTYLPVGVVGLVIAVIFSASMSSTSGEINSLATVTVVDLYRRYFAKDRDDHHYLSASRWFTAFWGLYAVIFASVGARGFGALIERVNIIGSLFYGGMLGVFTLAFFFPKVGGTAAFVGVIAGEIAIMAASVFTKISYLWYNVIGCLVVLLVALALTSRTRGTGGALPEDR